MLVQRLSQPEPRSRLPVRVDFHKATPCQGRAGGRAGSGGTFIEAKRRALTGVVGLRNRTGGSYHHMNHFHGGLEGRKSIFQFSIGCLRKKSCLQV